MIRIAELPREAFQALQATVPTDAKVNYLNAVLKAGFDTVEVTSIVSPKVLPQMADALEVIDKIDLTGSKSKVMVLVMNRKGTDLVAENEKVHSISYPFSISPSFLMRNQRSTTEEAAGVIDHIQNTCTRTGKEFVLYFSMAFGNPYNDPWSIELLVKWVETFYRKGIRIMPMSNVSIPVSEEKIAYVFSTLAQQFPELETGFHFHTSGKDWFPKLEAAWRNGCRRFDSVINGMGGCPMTGKELLANLDTRNLLHFLEKHKIPPGLDETRLREVYSLVPETFGRLAPFTFHDNKNKV
jgi:hydroxymethylglutaryl-CoA lyase